MTTTPKPKKQKLRNAEYYNLQETFDNLYSDSKSGKRFTKLKAVTGLSAKGQTEQVEKTLKP